MDNMEEILREVMEKHAGLKWDDENKCSKIREKYTERTQKTRVGTRR